MLKTFQTSTRPQLITELLRSDIPLPKDLRRRIADWHDSDGLSALCFKQFKRRKPGHHLAWSEVNLDIGLFIEERIQRKEKFEAAVAEARCEFSKERTTMIGAYLKVRAARRI